MSKKLQNQRTQSSLHKIESISKSRIHILDTSIAHKRMILADKEAHQKLVDYVFGDGENPFKEITAEVDHKNTMFDGVVEDIMAKTGSKLTLR